MLSSSKIKRRNGACFSIARTTAHAIMTEGDGASLPFFFFAASRALRSESHRASIWRFAGITRESFRVMVGERAGSILFVAGIADAGPRLRVVVAGIGDAGPGPPVPATVTIVPNS